VAEEICRRANGIPLYGFEYLRQAREALTPAQRQVPLAELPASMNAPLPIAVDPLRGVLMRSFDGLSAPENRALKAASVLGERFAPALLEALVNGEPPLVDLGAALRALVQRGLVTAGEPPRFSHALIQASCYETIPVHLRRTLHGRTAALLEQAGGPDSDERLLTLAHHHHFAENHDRSIHYSERAARRAHQQGAYRETMRLLDQCLHAAEQLPAAALEGGGIDRRIRWRRLKAEAAGAVGDGQTREQEAGRAIELCGARGPRPTFVRALDGALRLLRRSAADPRRLIATRGGHPAAERHRELARAHRQLAVGAYFLGRPVEMVYNTGRAMAHAARLGRSPELAECLASIGTVYGLTGFAAAAHRHLAAARALASELGDEPAIAYAEVSSALFLVGQGDWDNVQPQVERCQEISRRTGDTGYWGYGQALRFWMHHYRGETEAADRCAGELWEAAREAGNRQHQSWAARFLAQGSARRRDFAQARQQLETARALYHEAEKSRREVRPIYELQPILADLAVALYELSDREQALALHQTALRELGSARPGGHAILEGCSSLLHLQLAHLAASPDRDRLARAHRALALLRRYCRIFPIGQPRLHFWRGRLLALTGHRTAALTTWRAGAQAARALGMEHDRQRLESALASV
jgi:tetratricopeptide (TPR) repeat protein